MTVINTNISALIAHQTLARNDRDMSQAMTRLSTGMRINSAGDDAAGLAIATRMTAQMQGLDQAVRNANDAVSMIQTADGASSELGNIIQRMRVLAVQAISDTYTATDRQALNAEFSGLQEQLEIIATQTQWNGAPLMTGEIGNNGTSTFHIGANAEQSMEITFGDWTAAGRGVYRNGGSTPNNIGPTDLLETPTALAIKAVSAVYTSPISDAEALGSVGNLTLSDGTNTLTVDARSITDRSALVAKIQSTPGYSDLLFTISDNGGAAINGTAATYTTKLTDTATQAIASDLVLTDPSGNTLTVEAADITSLTSTDQLISRIQSDSEYSSMDFTIVAYDGPDSGSATDGIMFSMKKVGATANDPTMKIAGVEQNVELETPFVSPAKSGLSIIYKESGAVATPPTVTMNGMDRSTSKNAVYTVEVPELDIENAGSLQASKAFIISDGTSTVSVADVSNLTHPGYDGTLAPNTANLVAAVKAQPGYENLMFSVDMHPSNVNQMQFTYKAAGSVAFTPTASFGEVTAVAAQHELTPVLGVREALTVSDGSTTLNIPAPVAGVTAVPAVFTVPPVFDAAETLTITDGTTTITTASSTSANAGAMVTLITAASGYGDLNFTVAASGTNLVFTQKTAAPVASGKEITFTQSVSSNPTVAATTAGVTGVAAISGGVAWADASQIANAITGHSSYDSLNYTVRTSGSGASAKLVFDAKAVGPKTTAQQPTFTQATSANPTVSEVRGGVNAVSENAVRTVVTTTAGVDDDPTPELTRQGVTGRAAVASTPFTPSIDILTSDGAKAALDNLLTALDGINMQRASYGAAINRLEHTMDNLMQMSSNAAATRGRIQDADYAKESTELARTQIVQQASTAMLTQANQSAQSVLALLKG
jgi:flagellin